MTGTQSQAGSSYWTSTGLPVALLLVAMLSFQVGASIAKSLFPLVGPIGVVAIRVALGATVLWITTRPWVAAKRPQASRALIVYGVSMGLMNLFFYAALDRIPQGVAVAVEFIGPLAVAIVSSHRPIDFVWIAIASAGLILLLPVKHIGSAGDLYGIVLALAAGACWAIYIVSGQRAGAQHGMQVTAFGSLIAASIVVPLGIVKVGHALFAGSVLIPGLLVAILSTAIPYALEMVALTRLNARTFGVLMSLEPVLGALSAYAWLGEGLTARQWLAIALVMTSSAGATLGSR